MLPLLLVVAGLRKAICSGGPSEKPALTKASVEGVCVVCQSEGTPSSTTVLVVTLGGHESTAPAALADGAASVKSRQQALASVVCRQVFMGVTQ